MSLYWTVVLVLLSALGRGSLHPRCYWVGGRCHGLFPCSGFEACEHAQNRCRRETSRDACRALEL